MQLGLDGKVAIVTGASRGIGLATARLLAAEGARVALTYRSDRDAGECAAAEIRKQGAHAVSLGLDLGSIDSIRAATEAVIAEWGRVDVLVNNAVEFPTTKSGPARFDRVLADDWQRLIPVNVHGPFAAIQAVLPSMLRGGWGRIVNVSSIAADDGMSGYGWYAVAKASLHGLTRTLGRELSRAGILTNAVMPGPTLTERFEHSVPEQVRREWGAQTSLRRMANPDEVARTILFLCSAANTIVTGEVVRTGGRAA
jgi:3-oxoacyl-[acyl-carrier protein] reductase